MQIVSSQALVLAAAIAAASTISFPIALAQGNATLVRINEVSQQGTKSGTCGREDWTELYLPKAAPTSVDLSGYILHDDRGPTHEDAYTFPDGYVLEPGQYVVICHRGDDPDTSPQFGIGSNDTISLLDASGTVISQCVVPGSIGARDVDVTFAYDESIAIYNYTWTPTPGEANQFTEYVPETVEEMRARLIEQNSLGTDFFNMDTNGLEVEGGMPYLVDLRVEMDPDERQKMREERSYETYSDFLLATVTSVGDPNNILASLPSGGRIRPKGQSTLVFGTCLDRSVPYRIDFDRGTDPDQTLFGLASGFLRTHMSDGSFSREWVMHRMLARFGLPHMRARSVRLFINGVLEGLYTFLEAPDQDYVYQRSFPNFDRTSYGLYKVQTMSLGCGKYDEEGLLGPEIDLAEIAMARLNETSTPPYHFDRGDHRPLIPVLKGNWYGCAEAFQEGITQDFVDVALAYYRKNSTCGDFLVDQGLIDRDLGPETTDDVMKVFIDKHLGPKECDAGCTNSDLANDVDTSQMLRNFAVMSAMLHIDSPLVNGNNYYMAYNDGRWSMVQYDHNNMLDAAIVGLLCKPECEQDFIKWSVLRPTCGSIEENQIVGPLLSNETLQEEYLGYVREFVETVMQNQDFQEQIKDHLLAIEQAASADTWNEDDVFEYEVSDGMEWQVEITGGLFGASSYSPLLPAIRARAIEILKELDAIEEGSVRQPDDIEMSESCVAWDSEGPREVGDSCDDNCQYAGCNDVKGLTLPGFCDPLTRQCIHGQMDDKCVGITNTAQYAGMTPFEGSDQQPFCFTDDATGTPMKMAVCPAKAGNDDSVASPAGCPDNCLYEGCFREDFDIPAFCDPTTNRCIHGKVDALCEGVAPGVGYDGLENFYDSEEVPFCWNDQTLGDIAVAFCPDKTFELTTTTKPTIATPVTTVKTEENKEIGDGVTVKNNGSDVDALTSGSSFMVFPLATFVVQLSLLIVLA